MPHDCKGRLIEVGDVVKGKGYNIKHEIIGAALRVNPDATSCNLQIAIVKVQPATYGGCGYLYPGMDMDGRMQLITPSFEYGDCAAFEIIQKHDGTVPSN